MKFCASLGRNPTSASSLARLEELGRARLQLRCFALRRVELLAKGVGGVSSGNDLGRDALVLRRELRPAQLLGRNARERSKVRFFFGLAHARRGAHRRARAVLVALWNGAPFVSHRFTPPALDSGGAQLASMAPRQGRCDGWTFLDWCRLVFAVLLIALTLMNAVVFSAFGMDVLFTKLQCPVSRGVWMLLQQWAIVYAARAVPGACDCALTRRVSSAAPIAVCS
jgi:hypothetical protein